MVLLTVIVGSVIFYSTVSLDYPIISISNKSGQPLKNVRLRLQYSSRGSFSESFSFITPLQTIEVQPPTTDLLFNGVEFEVGDEKFIYSPDSIGSIATPGEIINISVHDNGLIEGKKHYGGDTKGPSNLITFERTKNSAPNLDPPQRPAGQPTESKKE